MQRSFNWLLGCVLALAATAAMAEFHTFQIDEIFSDASGTQQYVVMHEAFNMDGETFWAGNSLTTTHSGVTNTFVFPQNLPGGTCDVYGCNAALTANKRVLIATQGFAALGILTPDYVMPNGFIPTAGGTLNYAGVDQVSFAALPTDGVTAVNRNGAMEPNRATNFAGQSASVTAAPAVDLNQHGLTGSWYEAATSGQGVEVEVFPNASTGTGSTFVSWFTYDTVIGGAEHQRWYTAQGQVVTGQPNASLTIYQNTGGNFNAPPVTTPQAVGTATLSFSTCSSGQLAYSFTDGTGRTGNIALTRLTQNVTCATTPPYPTNADFALSGNWYGGAAMSGQGFTVEINPISGAFFSAWYTYMPSGTAAGAGGQRWYTAQGTFTPGMRSIPVQIFETTGGAFDTPTPSGQKTVAVGTGTMALQSCSAASFAYAFTGGTSIGLSGIITLSRVGPVPPGCTS
jgi:hypothetical protein